MLYDESITILLVDDDPDELTLIETPLLRAGYRTVKASNGSEALKLLHSHAPQLVLTDLNMPVMNGVDLCRAIRSHEATRFTQVIAITAGRDTDRMVELFNSGADDFIAKPVNPRELLARTGAAIRRLQLQHDLESKSRAVHRANAMAEIANNQLADANNRLTELATTDELTRLSNRREAFNRLAECWITSDRHGEPLSCLVIDIDHFKNCNDVHGHAAGDVLLKETALALQRAARLGEPVYRVGGEEFFVICPRATSSQASLAAERLRGAIESRAIPLGKGVINVTVSIGVATRTMAMKRPDDLFRAADSALYAAKRAGRNRVMVHGQCEECANGLVSCSETASRFSQVNDGAAGGRTVALVADDDPSAVALYRKLLSKEGFEVLVAADGVEVIKITNQTTPDVMIIDGQMPKLSGVECIRRIKANAYLRDVPVILASGLSEAQDIVDGLEAGADDYLTKPIQPRELALRVSNMVRIRRTLIRSNAVRGEQSRALALTSEFCWRLAAAHSLETALERTASVVGELTCCRGIAVFLFGAKKESLQLAYSNGVSTHGGVLTVPIQGSVLGRAIGLESGSIVGEEHDDSVHLHPSERPFFLGAKYVVIALQAPAGTVGAMVISGRQDQSPFSPLELEYVELVANIAAASFQGFQSRKARDEAHDSIVVALATLAEHRDTDTGKHLERVTQFCLNLANHLQKQPGFSGRMTGSFLDDLRRAVPLHDIGKVGVPDSILRKPGRLTPEERAIMQTHTVIGARAIQSVIERSPEVGFLRMAEEIAHGHHEWYNGQGYPLSLSRDAIPLAARIVAVADVYDALTTRRPYKEPISHSRAMQLIVESSASQFDPNVVSAFVECEAEFRKLAESFADSPGHQSFPDSADQPHPDESALETVPARR